MSMRKDKKPSSIQREETDTRILSAFESAGTPLSAAQLSKATDYPMSTVEKSIDRLRRNGFVRKLEERRRVGRFGHLACVYEPGDEEELPHSRKPELVVVRRHPMDVALFGEFVPAQKRAA
jgi:predicted transcriptional regulator